MDTTEELELSGDIKRRHNVMDEHKIVALYASMSNEGWTGRRLLVVDCGDHHVAITGVHRIEAARRAGLQTVPALILDEEELRGAFGIFVENEGDDYYLHFQGELMENDNGYRTVFENCNYGEAASLMQDETAESGEVVAPTIQAFLEANQGIALSERLTAFYDSKEYEKYQHRYIDDTSYMPSQMFVDFDRIKQLENGEFADGTIGTTYVPFANLTGDVDNDPMGYDIYAHLAIDPTTTKVYLVEPSGEPELIGENLDAVLARLKS
ncbi:MAG: ParB N-terminal domain-containing protein [Kofleriaceae bacterium]|nr:ParB N-terminal domain-containing protein [Kofleriaceae bacterium]